MDRGLIDLADAPDVEAEALERGYYLFVALDLQNGIAFRARYQRWPTVVLTFQRIAADAMLDLDRGFNVWKMVGDQALFWRRLRTPDEAPTIVAGLPALAEAVTDQLARDPAARTLVRQTLATAATAWLAQCHAPDLGSAAERRRIRGMGERLPAANMVVDRVGALAVEESGLAAPHPEVEFIGPHVERGLRLAQYAPRHAATLSAKLAHLVHRLRPELAAGARLIDWRPLPAAVYGRPYPIIVQFGDVARWRDRQLRYDETGLDGGAPTPLAEALAAPHDAERLIAAVSRFLEDTAEMRFLDGLLPDLFAGL